MLLDEQKGKATPLQVEVEFLPKLMHQCFVLFFKKEVNLGIGK